MKSKDMNMDLDIVDTNRRLYDEQGHGYDKVSYDPEEAYIVNPMVFSAIGSVEGKSILDLACGAGFYLKKFVERGGADLVGVDMSEGMLDTARRLLGDRVTLIKEDIGRPDLDQVVGTKRFDVVFCAWGLFYMETDKNLDDCLSTCYRALKDDGTAYFVLGDDKKIKEGGIEKLIQVEILDVVRGDWTGPTYTKKALAGDFICQDLWRPYEMLEAACKRAGFTKVDKVETLFDDYGLMGWSAEDWEKIKEVKPVFVIVCRK
jgi:SAM-dependent methyltransferase